MSNNNYLPRKYRRYLGLGAEIAATLLIPLMLGYIIDIYLDISPWGLLMGAAAGIVFFFFSIFRIARKLENNKE